MDLEPIVCNADGLFQAWNAFAYLHLHPSVGYELVEVVLGNDLFMKYVQADLHILIACHRIIVIFFSNIQSEETGMRVGDGAIQKALSRHQAGIVGYCVAREFQLVAANSDTDTMSFGLVGPDAGNKS